MAIAEDWARFGHQLARYAAAVHADPKSALTFDVVGSTRYVQWHGEQDDEFYMEASSGIYNDDELSTEQQALLARLGWDAPGQGWGKDDVLNWSRHFEAPVSLYDVVRLTVATLRDVFAAEPDGVELGI